MWWNYLRFKTAKDKASDKPTDGLLSEVLKNLLAQASPLQSVAVQVGRLATAIFTILFHFSITTISRSTAPQTKNLFCWSWQECPKT